MAEDINQVPAEGGLDRADDLPDLCSEHGFLKSIHHPTAAKPAQISPLLLVRFIQGEFGGQIAPLFTCPDAIQKVFCFLLFLNQDMAGPDLLLRTIDLVLEVCP